ncbi:MAG: hypothetical protein WCE54_08540 [Ignavibacteriaceae bacterium]
MALLVLGYPKLKVEDFERIQNIRLKYDLRYFNVVNPYFTVAFPVFDFLQNEFNGDIINKFLISG